MLSDCYIVDISHRLNRMSELFLRTESVVKTLLRFKAILQVKTPLRLKANFQGHCGDVESLTSRAYDVTLC